MLGVTVCVSLNLQITARRRCWKVEPQRRAEYGTRADASAILALITIGPYAAHQVEILLFVVNVRHRPGFV